MRWTWAPGLLEPLQAVGHTLIVRPATLTEDPLIAIKLSSSMTCFKATMNGTVHDAVLSGPPALGKQNRSGERFKVLFGLADAGHAEVAA